jgi:O-antigen ligase
MIFNKKNFWKFILVLVGALLVLGGLGIETDIVQYVGVAVGILLLVLSVVWRKKIELPPGSLLYIIFLALMLLSMTWSKDRQASFEYLVLFSGGGLFWAAFYNLKKEFEGGFDKLVIILGLIFGILFIVSSLLGGDLISGKSLYLHTSVYKNHNHLGDLWAVVVLISGYYLIKTRKRLYWPIISLGICFLAISLSRAAYVALAAGLIYLFVKQNWLIKHKKALKLFALVFVGLFVFAGAQKITLFSRPYFVQGIVGFLRNPLGVGMGNFSIISSDLANHLWGMDAFSSIAHNIVLEILTGMGVFGFTFLAWLVIVLKDVWRNNKTKNIIYQALFVALGVNFFFDTTYFIPTMLWLWFASLGLAQLRKEKNKKKISLRLETSHRNGQNDGL